MISERCNRFQQLLDLGARIRMPEYRISNNQDIRTRFDSTRKCREIDSAVDFDGAGVFMFIDDLSRLPDLIQRVGYKCLTAKSGLTLMINTISTNPNTCWMLEQASPG